MTTRDQEMVIQYLESRIVEVDRQMNELHRRNEALSAIREQLWRWRAELKPSE